MLAQISVFIEDEELASFKGKDNRATKLDENLIFKLSPGIVFLNTTFCSTSKDLKVGERFMKNKNGEILLLFVK